MAQVERGKGISRRGMDSMPQRKRRAASAQTTDTYVRGKEPLAQPDTATRIASAMVEFSGTAASIYDQENKKKIELDKVTQQQRAFEGLDPTKDATEEGVRAFQVVKMRDQILETNSDISTKIRENPDMSDEDFEKMTREAYAPLFDQYRPDAQLSKALGNQIQQSQSSVYQVRSAAKAKHNEFERDNAVTASISNFTEAAGSTEELAESVAEGGVMYEEARGLGATPQDIREKLVSAASFSAAEGDGRLLKALQKQKWTKTDPRISKAEANLQQYETRANAAEIGDKWGSIQEAWKSRASTWDSTMGEIKNLNKKYPGSITAKNVASLKQKAARQHSTEDRNNAVYQNWVDGQEASKGEGEILPLGTDVARQEDVNMIIGKESEHIEKLGQQYEASGRFTPAERQGWVLNKKLELGREQNARVPGIGFSIDALVREDFGDWSGEGVPEVYAQTAMMMERMNEDDIRKYTSNDRTAGFIRAYQDFRSEKGADKGALQRARTVVDGNMAATSEERDEVQDEAVTMVGEMSKAGFWSSTFGDGEDMSPALIGHLENSTRGELTNLFLSGSTDPDKSAEIAAKSAYKNITRVGETFVNTSKESLLPNLTYRSEGGTQHQLNPADIRPAFEKLFEDIRDDLALESNYGADISLDKVMFTTTGNGSLIHIHDALGERITDKPIRVSDVAKNYGDAEALSRARSASDSLGGSNSAPGTVVPFGTLLRD